MKTNQLVFFKYNYNAPTDLDKLLQSKITSKEDVSIIKQQNIIIKDISDSVSASPEFKIFLEETRKENCGDYGWNELSLW